MTDNEQIRRTTEENIRKAFVRDLATLLRKYSAEIEVAGDDNMEVYIPAKYENHECVQRLIFINLGRWFNGGIE